ncbi:MAG: bleomycin hydrolase [Polaribacter sp.]|jgi:bleomycin hydrolase
MKFLLNYSKSLLRKSTLPILLMAGSALPMSAQVEMKSGYAFQLEKGLNCTAIKSQGNTGTCWSFATSSFLESELLRIGKEPFDLSEMYVVRNIYKEKARNYVLRQGKANFSQGSLSHDVINAAKKYGLVPETAYSGKTDPDQKHNHGEMAAVLKGMLDGVLKQKRLSDKWMKVLDAAMDIYLGAAPEQFSYEGKTYDPKSFAKDNGINPDDYISLTSYTHHDFYDEFILEIPDNFSNGAFHNLPMDELMTVFDNAIKNGYSVAWDGDVSEKGFSSKEGMAVLPVDTKRKDLFEQPGKEVEVDQALRQRTFESYATTDDHLMHLTGIAKDKKGTKYYLIKNSWGEIGPEKGYLYMSEAYAKLKTVAIMVHKDAVPKNILEKLDI